MSVFSTVPKTAEFVDKFLVSGPRLSIGSVATSVMQKPFEKPHLVVTK
jgi:hypothetical protein